MEHLHRACFDSFDATAPSLGDMTKGFQAFAAHVTDYSKKVFEDGTRASAVDRR